MPKLSSFATSVLLQQGAAFEPQRVSNWAVIIPGLDQGDLLVLSVKSASIPGMNVVKKGIKYFNTTAYYAGALSPMESFTIEYHDYLDRDILGILARWHKTVYNPDTGGIGFASQYKRDGSLFLLPPGMPIADAPGVVNSQEYADRTFRLKGVWPAVLKYAQLDHESDGENALINLELSVDMAYPKAMSSRN